MKVGIVAPRPEPFVRGGAERLWDTLKASLEARGNRCELVTLPFPENDLRQVLEGYLAFEALDVSRFDVVITGKYPAWMVDHPAHLVYLLHPLRGLHDTYPPHLEELEDTAAGRALIEELTLCPTLPGLARRALAVLDRLGDDPLTAYPGPLARWVVRRLDGLALDPSRIRTYAAISEEVASRPGYLPETEPVLVAHPQSDLTPVDAPTGGITTFFTASRHDRPKRIDLVIESFAEVGDASARLLIAGDGPDRARLEQLAADDQRVEFLGRLADGELAEAYARATAVVFTPEHEDFGYITLEAMAAGTPVVTTYDSGGPRELVEHGVNGMVVEPEPKALAWAMSHIADSPFVRWHQGLNARRTASAVRWDALLDEIEGTADDTRRPRALVLSTYGVDPALGGGQRRIRHLDRALARFADVTVLALSGKVDRTRRRRLEPGIDQVEIARSEAQIEAEDDMFDFMELPVDDLTVGRMAVATPAYGDELRRQLGRADVVIASQPFLTPTLPEHTDVPFVHDSQNAEFLLKADLLPDTPVGRWFLTQGREAERLATVRADLVVACTDDDLASLRSLDPDRQHAGLVVANGVDTAAMPIRTVDQQARARAEILALSGFDVADERRIGIFIGSWHPPNIEAGRLVLELAARRPDWIFILAGSHTSSYADEPLPDNVHLIAIFSETLLWPLLAAADVALNPMVSGGGSNLKLFDYLSIGTPVLATEIGVRGLEEPQRVTVVVEPDRLSEGLDFVADARRSDELSDRVGLGRALVEEQFDWSLLGRTWAGAILDAAGITAPAERPISHRPPGPLLASTPPPPSDPVLAAMEAMEAKAVTGIPHPLDTTMDPVLRELLTKASDNRHVGRVLPDEARLRTPKRALIRAGQALSNEQLTFNETAIDILEHLAMKVDALHTENEALLTRIKELERRLDDQ